MAKTLSQILDTLPATAVDDLKEWVAERIESVQHIGNVQVSLNPIKTTIELNATKKSYAQLTEMFVELATYNRKDKNRADHRDSFTV
jgi:uncharacterized protein YqgV (UPF0045/DUF77 family)